MYAKKKCVHVCIYFLIRLWHGCLESIGQAPFKNGNWKKKWNDQKECALKMNLWINCKERNEIPIFFDVRITTAYLKSLSEEILLKKLNLEKSRDPTILSFCIFILCFSEKKTS